MNRHGATWMRSLMVGMGSLAAAALLAWPAPALAGGAATAAVKQTVDEVIRILADEKLKKPDKIQERRRLLEKVVGARFGYDEMSKRTLAAHWQKLDAKQREEFTELFKRLLTNSYADKVEGYTGEQIHYINERNEGDYAEVRTRVANGKTEIPLDYRLLNKGGDWRVYDVVVDGVSLVNNYRGQFAKIIRTSGYDDLVKQLQDKSDKFVKLKTTEGKE